MSKLIVLLQLDIDGSRQIKLASNLCTLRNRLSLEQSEAWLFLLKVLISGCNAGQYNLISHKRVWAALYLMLG